MASRFNTYRLSCGLIFHDLRLLYTNFLHWNFSKIAVLLYAMIAGLILSLPFLAGLSAIGYMLFSQLPSDTSGQIMRGVIDLQFFQFLNAHVWWVLGGVFLWIIIFTIFSFTFSYTYLLLLKIYEGYLVGKKLSLKENLYFSRTHIIKYLGVLAWTSLYILPPLLFWLGAFIVLFFLRSYGLIDPQSNPLHATLLWGIWWGVLIISIFWLIIRWIRLSFSYMYLLDDNIHTIASREFVRKSLELSRWKILQIASLALPFVILINGTSGIFELGRSYAFEFRVASVIEQAQKEEKDFGDDHTYVKTHLLNPQTLSENDLMRVIQINNHYAPVASWVNMDYIHDILPFIQLGESQLSWKDDVREWGFWLAQFLLFNSALLMVYYSIFSILRSTKELEEENVSKTSLKEIKKTEMKKSSSKEKKASSKKTLTTKKPSTKKEVTKKKSSTTQTKEKTPKKTTK